MCVLEWFPRNESQNCHFLAWTNFDGKFESENLGDFHSTPIFHDRNILVSSTMFDC